MTDETPGREPEASSEGASRLLPDLRTDGSAYPMADDLASPALGGLPDIAAGTDALAPARWVWAAMAPPERRARFRELADWVDWLVATHTLHNTVPRCWYRHPPVIEHLTALYAGWVRTYCVEEGDTGGGRDLAEAEWLATLHNFTPYLHVAACVGSDHQEPPARRASSAEAADELAAFLWTSDFGTGPARHPAPEAAARLYADDDDLL